MVCFGPFTEKAVKLFFVVVDAMSWLIFTLFFHVCLCNGCNECNVLEDKAVYVKPGINGECVWGGGTQELTSYLMELTEVLTEWIPELCPSY